SPRPRRHSRVQPVLHRTPPRSFVREKEERLVTSVVDLWNPNRSADRTPWKVLDAGLARAGEKTSCPKPGRRVIVEHGPMALLRSGLGNDRHLPDRSALRRLVRPVDLHPLARPAIVGQRTGLR